MPVINDIERIFGAIKELEARVETLENPTWTSWPGGECPVYPSIHVEVRLRDGRQGRSLCSHFSWLHSGNAGDIISYRVAQ